MTVDERLTKAARRLAGELTVPDVDLDAIRSRARANQRRNAALVVSASVVAVILVATVTGVGRETSAQLSPVGPPSPTTPAESMIDLPAGAPPSTPYWHDGVLHVRGLEIETPFQVGVIEVAGDTVMVGGGPGGGLQNGSPTEWALVSGDQLVPLPAEGWGAELSLDGRIAFWTTNPTPDTTQFVAWDTETNTELATRSVPRSWDGSNDRLQMVGIDADGIGYWVDESSDHPVTRWDVRADTVEPTDVPYDTSKTFENQAAPLPEVWVGFEDSYESPDGTREVFTDGDELRVRPVGSAEPGDVVPLELPEGIPEMRLWDAYSDRGMWWLWWETDDTVLLDASRDGQSHLVRCSAGDGGCELVFDLGANSSEGIMYLPDWEQDWAFARFPVAE